MRARVILPIVTGMLTLALAAAALLSLRLPAAAQPLWEAWAAVGPDGVRQTLNPEGALSAIAVGLGCSGNGCRARLVLSDDAGTVYFDREVGSLEDITNPARKPYGWTVLRADVPASASGLTLRVQPGSANRGDLFVRASRADVYQGGEARSIAGIADLSFQLYDGARPLEQFRRLFARASDGRPGIWGQGAFYGGILVLFVLLAAVGVTAMIRYALAASESSDSPGQNST